MKFFLRCLGVSAVIAGTGVLIFLAFAGEGVEISQDEPWGLTILWEFKPHPTLSFNEFIEKVKGGKIIEVYAFREVHLHQLFGIKRQWQGWCSPIVAYEGLYQPKRVYHVEQEWNVPLPAQFDPEALEELLSSHGVEYSWMGSTAPLYWGIIVVPGSLFVGYLIAAVWEAKVRRQEG